MNSFFIICVMLIWICIGKLDGLILNDKCWYVDSVFYMVYLFINKLKIKVNYRLY